MKITPGSPGVNAATSPGVRELNPTIDTTRASSTSRPWPGVLGAVENVNRSNLEAGFYIHAMVNVLPRIRQFVKQLNATLVKVYDPLLELDFESPVPEDAEAKLKTAKEGVDRWWTKDEVRAQYGDAPLPDNLGAQIVVAGKGAVSLESVLNPEPPPTTSPAADTSKASNDQNLWMALGLVT